MGSYRGTEGRLSHTNDLGRILVRKCYSAKAALSLQPTGPMSNMVHTAKGAAKSLPIKVLTGQYMSLDDMITDSTRLSMSI
jgi:hypothetical protein